MNGSDIWGSVGPKQASHRHGQSLLEDLNVTDAVPSLPCSAICPSSPVVPMAWVKLHGIIFCGAHSEPSGGASSRNQIWHLKRPQETAAAHGTRNLAAPDRSTALGLWAERRCQQATQCERGATCCHCPSASGTSCELHSPRLTCQRSHRHQTWSPQAQETERMAVLSQIHSSNLYRVLAEIQGVPQALSSSFRGSHSSRTQ